MTLDELNYDIDKLRRISEKPAGKLVAQDIDVVFSICHRYRIAPQNTILTAVQTLETMSGNWRLADMRRLKCTDSLASRKAPV